MSRLRERIAEFAKDTRGNASVEFVVVFPFIIAIFFMFGEIGVYTARTTLLKRGVDIAIRDIRLGINATADPVEFRRTVCQNAFLSNCEDDLTIDMSPIDVTARNSLSAPIACRNRTDPNLTPVTGFDAGGEGDIILVRTCLIGSPAFPGVGLAVGLEESSGGYAIVVTSAFKNECSDLTNCT